MITLGELADRLDLRFAGDRQQPVRGLASLASAGPDQLTFMTGARHVAALRATRAAAVMLPAEFADDCPGAALVCEAPYLAFARASRLFGQDLMPAPGIHPAAVVDPAARVHPAAAIGPGAVVEAGAMLDAGAALAAGVFVGRGARIGQGTHIHAHAVVHAGVVIGAACVVHSHAVLGGAGFGFAPGPAGWERIHALGGLRIGDGVHIGAATTIDRGTLDDTVIADGVIIDNQVQIAHNCRIGAHTAIAACCGLAGSTVIGAHCTLAGGVGVVGHVELCDHVHITGMTMVTRSIREPGSYSSGTPMADSRSWKRNAVRFGRLDALYRRLAQLERRLLPGARG